MPFTHNVHRLHRRSEGGPRGLVVLLHGVGASAANFAGLAELISQRFPDLEIAVPDAPSVFDRGPGRQWFSISGVTEENRPARVEAALPQLVRFAEEELGRHDLTADRLILLGFSQGAIMALEYLAASNRAAGVIALSGRLAGPPRRRLPATGVHFCHGTDDPVIDVCRSRKSAAWLSDAGADVTYTELMNLGHAIDTRVERRVISALRDLRDNHQADAA